MSHPITRGRSVQNTHGHSTVAGTYGLRGPAMSSKQPVPGLTRRHRCSTNGNGRHRRGSRYHPKLATHSLIGRYQNPGVSPSIREEQRFEASDWVPQLPLCSRGALPSSPLWR